MSFEGQTAYVTGECLSCCSTIMVLLTPATGGASGIARALTTMLVEKGYPGRR